MNPPATLKLKARKMPIYHGKSLSNHGFYMKLRQELKRRKVMEFALPHSCMSEVKMPLKNKKYNGFTFNSQEDQRNLRRSCNRKIWSRLSVKYKRTSSKIRILQQATTKRWNLWSRGLSIYCNFTNLDEALRDQFVFNIRCEKAKTKLINDSYSSPKIYRLTRHLL